MVFEFASRVESAEQALKDIPRETLFKVNGVAFTIPVRCPATTPLAYATMMRMGASADECVSWALEFCLGRDGLNALINAEGIEDSQLRTIVAVVLRRVQGAEGVADPKEAPPAETEEKVNPLVRG